LFSDHASITEIQNEAKELISTEILPAFKNLEIFILDEYMNHVRTSPGIWALPDGSQMYKAYLEYHTSLDDITAGFFRTEVSVDICFAYLDPISKVQIYSNLDETLK
jgi:hypothetical protein